jgi:hypothetical protein
MTCYCFLRKEKATAHRARDRALRKIACHAAGRRGLRKEPVRGTVWWMLIPRHV